MYDAFNVRFDCALRRVVLAVCGLIAFGVSGVAAGQGAGNVYSWGVTGYTPRDYTKAGACAAVVPSQLGSAGSGFRYVADGWTNTGGVLGYGVCKWKRERLSDGTFDSFQNSYFNRTTVPAPPPASCSGLASDGVGDKFTSSHFPGADGYCNAVSHCKMKVSSSVTAGGATLYSITHSSEVCTHGAVPSPVGDQATPGETCGGASPEFCLARAGENCGYLNDSFVCLPKVGETKCAVFGDGGRVCGNSAPTPPVPDNGTPGTVATPAATVQSTVNNVTTTLNYFNATQVAGSSRDPGSTGDNPYDDGPGEGGECDPATEECGEGSVTGGEFCSEEPICTGDAIQCAIVEQQWRNRCVASLTNDEKTAMFVGLPNDDIDGDGSSEGIAEGMPGSSDEPIDILSDFDSDGWLGGRTCPAIYNVDLPAAFGGVINISLADACFFFQLIGSIVLVMAWFEAAKIVVTGFF